MQTASDESRILGVDYGDKRIGLALSDPTKIFAYPYQTIENNKSLLSRLAEIIHEKNVLKIIIGLPSSDFKASKILAEKVKLLKEKIEIQLKIEVVLWNEDYTSVIAEEKMLESVRKKSKRKDKGVIDSLSAAVILQEYLDSSRTK